jgi:hypothetical protein
MGYIRDKINGIETYVCPLYSTINLCNARQLLKLTEPIGPGAGWHLRAICYYHQIDKKWIRFRRTSSKRPCLYKHPFQEEPPFQNHLPPLVYRNMSWRCLTNPFAEKNALPGVPSNTIFPERSCCSRAAFIAHATATPSRLWLQVHSFPLYILWRED